MKVKVLRLSHRKQRDKRITTHVFLVARAFGATTGCYTGDRDENMEKNIKEVTEKWGNSFTITHATSHRKVIATHLGFSIHLTMYGHSHLRALPVIKKMISEEENDQKEILIIVGGKKVPADVYKLVDFNVAIGFQPHSEVAALAIFLYELLGKQQAYLPRKNAELQLKGGEKARGRLDGRIT